MKRMVDLALINLLASLADAGITAESIQNPKMEEIVDADGHKRFQEWEPTLPTISGVTFTYAKASLSGTHLMIVLAGSATDTSVIGNGSTLADFGNLPSWLLEKIVPLWANEWVDNKIFTAYADNWSTQGFGAALAKRVSGGVTHIIITKASDITFTADRTFRVQFDLLIE